MQDRWVNVGSPGIGFTAQMPGTPVSDLQQQQGVEVLSIQLQHGKSNYIVGAASLSVKGRKDLSEMLMDSSVDLLVNFRKGKVVHRKVLSTSNVVGREFKVELPDVGFRWSRDYVDGDRMYSIAIEGPQVEVEGSDGTRFIESFRLSNR